MKKFMMNFIPEHQNSRYVWRIVNFIQLSFFVTYRRIVHFAEKSKDLNSKNFAVCQEIIKIFITSCNRFLKLYWNQKIVKILIVSKNREFS